MAGGSSACLPTLAKTPPDALAWSHEVKFDDWREANRRRQEFFERDRS
jgi:hypothetical protein